MADLKIHSRTISDTYTIVNELFRNEKAVLFTVLSRLDCWCRYYIRNTVQLSVNHCNKGSKYNNCRILKYKILKT